MMTMQEAATIIPVDWALNTLVSGILIDNNAEPDFMCNPADIEAFEDAAPDLAQALVNNALNDLPPQVSSNLDDEEIQEIDRQIRQIAHEAFACLKPESQVRFTNLVRDMIDSEESAEKNKMPQYKYDVTIGSIPHFTGEGPIMVFDEKAIEDVKSLVKSQSDFVLDSGYLDDHGETINFTILDDETGEEISICEHMTAVLHHAGWAIAVLVGEYDERTTTDEEPG